MGGISIILSTLCQHSKKWFRRWQRVLSINMDQERVSEVILRNTEEKKLEKKKRKIERNLQTKISKRLRQSEKKSCVDPFLLAVEQDIDKVQFYHQNGFRKVYPYYYNFASHAKGRWVGRKLIEIMHDEFFVESHTLMTEAFSRGQIVVNGKSSTADYKVNNNDLIEHKVHRHEMPVLNFQLDVIKNDDELLVINKPPSWPVHPSGRYRYNSLIYILYKDYNFRNLRNVNRLDRLTSGVMLIAKTSDKAKQLIKQIQNNQINKHYICRVEGVFPEEDVDCRLPMNILNKKIGLHYVCFDGKPARTVFNRISTDGATSLVHCKLFTGRTHQIRVHLQYLGYPIVNDNLYNSKAWGPMRGRGGNWGKSTEQLIADLMKSHGRVKYLVKNNVLEQFGEAESDLNRARGADVPEQQTTEAMKFLPEIDELTKHRPITELTSKTLEPYDSQKIEKSDICPDCINCYRDPDMDDLLICLHAHIYEGPDWKFEAPLPTWAYSSNTVH